MKRILINATHNEEVRVALCKGNHLYDFDLENRTREQKKANIYKGHVTRVEPSLEAVFVEYGSKRQGFLPVREIAPNYLSGNPRDENIRKLIKEGDELIVQVEKEERGNKGAALSTYVSLAGRYLVLMPNNPRGGGISRQISGKLREDMKRMLGNLDLPKGMSVIVRTAGIGKTQEDLQHDLDHLINIWTAIQDQNKQYPSPRLVHQEAGVVTRAVRDYLRDDITEIWIDNEEAFIEAETFIKAVMPKQLDKLCKYTEYEPMFTHFNVERQIETAYQREVRLPSGGSIVIDQTEALVSIDINSAKSTKGADVSETAFHTNLEAADEIARQLRLRDMGGLIVIDFIDMNDNKSQKDVEKRLVEATKYDRARVQFSDISRFGLMEMSRQRLRPSLEESTGYICPRCNGNGMIRDLRSLSLSIMRQIEQTALKERHGEIQAEVPTEIAAFLLNEKRESLVYLEQDSGTRITILPHAHLESPNFNLHFNHQGFAPSSYERVTDTHEQETNDRGYEVNWQTADAERPAQQPTRQPKKADNGNAADTTSNSVANTQKTADKPTPPNSNQHAQAQLNSNKPAAVAWLSNLFAPTPQAQTTTSISSAEAAQAIEAIVNTGAPSRGAFGEVAATSAPVVPATADLSSKPDSNSSGKTDKKSDNNEKDRRRSRNNKSRTKYDKTNNRNRSDNRRKQDKEDGAVDSSKKPTNQRSTKSDNASQKALPKRESNSKRESRGPIERGDAKKAQQQRSQDQNKRSHPKQDGGKPTVKTAKQTAERPVEPAEVNVKVTEAQINQKESDVVHISLEEGSASTTNNSTNNTANNKVDDHSKNRASNKQTPQSNNNASEQKVTTANVVSNDDSVSSNNESTKQANIKPIDDDASNKNDVASTNNNLPTNTDSDVSDSATMTFNPNEVFADRYVAAQKFGTASNDPRVVMQKAQQPNDNLAEGDSDESTASHETKTPATNKINGSVGDFIHRHLSQASTRIDKDGVIKSFLSALNAYSITSEGTPAKAKKPKAKIVPKQAFSFVNYGYDALSPSYLKQFSTLTSATDTYDTEQGKTDVNPAPICKRASNDPRGQHPDYVPVAGDDNIIIEDQAGTQESPVEAALAEKADDPADSQSTQHKSPAEAMGELLKLNVGNFISRVLNEEGIELINAGQTEAAFLKALRQPLEVLVSVAQSVESSVEHALEQAVHHNVTDDNDTSSNNTTDTQTSKTKTNNNESAKVAESSVSPLDYESTNDTQTAAEHPADALTSASHAEEISADNTEILADEHIKHEHSQAENAADQTDDSSNASKTSIESYKSMIENISEQLLPQTGLLHLGGQKVPKTRMRKSKVDNNKPNDDDKQ